MNLQVIDNYIINIFKQPSTRHLRSYNYQILELFILLNGNFHPPTNNMSESLVTIYHFKKYLKG